MPRTAGSIEWRLHPAALLRLRVAADLRWVRGGFVLDGAVSLGPRRTDRVRCPRRRSDRGSARFGVCPRDGAAALKFKSRNCARRFPAPQPRFGRRGRNRRRRSCPQRRWRAARISAAIRCNSPTRRSVPTPMPTGRIADTGGPLSVDAEIRVSVKRRSAMLSGTLQERADGIRGAARAGG